MKSNVIVSLFLYFNFLFFENGFFLHRFLFSHLLRLLIFIYFFESTLPNVIRHTYSFFYYFFIKRTFLR